MLTHAIILELFDAVLETGWLKIYDKSLAKSTMPFFRKLRPHVKNNEVKAYYYERLAASASQLHVEHGWVITST